MSVYIYSKISKKSRGGGNQFLKILKETLIKENLYTNNIISSKIIIVNGHEKFKGIFFILFLKFFFKKRILHRIDGPLAIVRGSRRQLLQDKSIFYFNQIVSDMTIFQSKWSLKIYNNLNFMFESYNILYNFVDDNIFFKKKSTFYKEKINLVSVSWSTNLLKGFDVIEYLDKNLDFKRFNYYFIGNSPLKFENIKIIEPLDSLELSEHFSKCDFYIHPSKAESCSNALLEAIQCGLTPIVRKNSSNKELVNDQKFLFHNKYDIIKKIDFLSSNKDNCKFFLDNNANKKKYINFIIDLINNNKGTKKINIIYLIFNIIKFMFYNILFKLYPLKNINKI